MPNNFVITQKDFMAPINQRQDKWEKKTSTFHCNKPTNHRNKNDYFLLLKRKIYHHVKKKKKTAYINGI